MLYFIDISNTLWRWQPSECLCDGTEREDAKLLHLLLWASNLWRRRRSKTDRGLKLVLSMPSQETGQATQVHSVISADLCVKDEAIFKYYILHYISRRMEPLWFQCMPVVRLKLPSKEHLVTRLRTDETAVCTRFETDTISAPVCSIKGISKK